MPLPFRFDERSNRFATVRPWAKPSFGGYNRCVIRRGTTQSGWRDKLERWLAPFLDRLGHKAQARMCPLYVAGLMGPGVRTERRGVTMLYVVRDAGPSASGLSKLEKL